MSTLRNRRWRSERHNCERNGWPRLAKGPDGWLAAAVTSERCVAPGGSEHMPRSRRRSGLSRQALPESLTRHLFNSTGAIAKTPDGPQRSSRLSRAAQKFAVSLISFLTFGYLVLAGGHVLEIW